MTVTCCYSGEFGWEAGIRIVRDVFAPCKSRGAVRELVYPAVTVYFGGLMETADGAILLCIDNAGRVIDKLQIDW